MELHLQNTRLTKDIFYVHDPVFLSGLEIWDICLVVRRALSVFLYVLWKVQVFETLLYVVSLIIVYA